MMGGLGAKRERAQRCPRDGGGESSTGDMKSMKKLIAEETKGATGD